MPTRWRRLRPLVGLACVAVAASGCDFTPVLDIPLPEHQPGLVLHGLLVADSTVTLTVRRSQDPYTYPSAAESNGTPPDVTVELVRGGAVVEALRLRSETCVDYTYVGGDPLGEPEFAETPYECGRFVSESRIAAGETYTVRARVGGGNRAEATVTVPARVDVSEVAETGRSVSFRLRDPDGLGQRYAVQLAPVIQTYSDTYVECDHSTGRPTNCRDTTVTSTSTYVPPFTTRDPLLLAASRLPSDRELDFVTFDDRAFDGQERAFTLELAGVRPRSVWVVALDPESYQAYQATYFSLGEDNPFEEPANLPSNVVGGYGLVGGAVIHDRALPHWDCERDGAACPETF